MAAGTLARVSILDEAREGMDTTIRPQDDLFGHVNGRWLEQVEIPSDRSSWGPFVELADVAEQQVHAIIEELAAADRETLTEDARKIADLYRSFMDTDTIAERGSRPLQPLVAAVEGLRDVRDLAAFLGEFERLGGFGLFGSYVDTDAKNSDRYLLNIIQGGLGPARRVVLPRRQVRRDPREVRRVPDPDVRARRPARPGRRGRDRAGRRHPALGRPLGARRDA